MLKIGIIGAGRMGNAHAANIANIDVLPTMGLNVLDILKHEKLVLTADAVKAIEARLA